MKIMILQANLLYEGLDLISFWSQTLELKIGLPNWKLHSLQKHILLDFILFNLNIYKTIEAI
jgi:hypothetical protein